MPVRPPTTESEIVSTRNCRMMCVCVGAEGAADADLAGPLGDGGEHDVHDADAADEQRDRGDHAHEAHEHEPRDAGLLEQFFGHDDGDVESRRRLDVRSVHDGVAALDRASVSRGSFAFDSSRHAERLADEIGRGADVLDGSDPERDLIQLDDLGVRELPRRVIDEVADALAEVVIGM